MRMPFAALCVMILASGSAFGQAVPESEASPQQLNGDSNMGDWKGAWSAAPAGLGAELCAQVIALGGGAYQANLLPWFDSRHPALAVLQGASDGNAVRFSGEGAGKCAGTKWTALMENGTFTGAIEGAQQASFSLTKTERLSPTVGLRPPPGAIALFRGLDLKEWVQVDPDGEPCRWRLLDNGAMEVRDGGIKSKREFGDHKVHVEFRTPLMPEAREQGRGNSGVYLQGRYEVQILDSYGLDGKDNECGGLYKTSAPRVNMCAPPLQWQTYDINFFAPRFDANGRKTQDARMTVYHNGVMIQEDVSVPEPTAANIGGDPTKPGPLHLQDHGNPVWFRNIWVMPLDEEE